MPEYHCVNIGIEGYPVWLTLSDKVTIVAIQPAGYQETSLYESPEPVLLKTEVALAVKGCAVYVKTPANVESVCGVLGFAWDKGDVVEPEKTDGGGPQ